MAGKKFDYADECLVFEVHLVRNNPDITKIHYYEKLKAGALILLNAYVVPKTVDESLMIS